MSATSVSTTDASTAGTGLYRMVWRWHFFAGLLSIPIIVLLCISGIVWLMRPEITWLLHRDAMKVEAPTKPLSYGQQLEGVAKRYPGSAPYQLGTPTTPTSATLVNITTKEGKDLSVWVDPSTGNVTGSRNNGTDVTAISLKLHGSLMTGSWLGKDKWGDRAIEIVAGWTILLLVTGTYLFWPRGKRRGWRQALTVRRSARSTNRRIVWRDVHAISGILFSFLTLFFLVTGMMWTGWWGTKYSEVTTKLGSTYPAGMWDGAESQTADSIKRTGKGGWLSVNAPIFASGTKPVGTGSTSANQSGQANHAGHNHAGKVSWEPGAAAPVDAIVGTAQAAGYPPGFSLTFPGDEKGSWGVWYGPDSDPKPKVSATDERMMYIDQYTAEPIRDFTWARFGVGAKAFDLGISIHEGRELGWWTQILMLVATLAVLVSCATSLVMWRKRKPRGLGAPKRTGFARRRDAIVVVACAIALGAFFPLLGLSMLVVLAIDLLLIRRIPPLRRALAG